MEHNSYTQGNILGGYRCGWVFGNPIRSLCSFQGIRWDEVAIRFGNYQAQLKDQD
jgi:hypothetical protein